MFIKNRKMLVSLLPLIVLLVILPACSQNAAEARSGPQVVVITQVATQIVVPTAPTYTPQPPPTATPAAVSIPTGGWDPFSVPIYYPIIGCAASRLHLGDTAIVANSGHPKVGIYKYKEWDFEPNLYQPPLGTELEIVDGPWCHEGWLFWQVEQLNTSENLEIVGYMPEGDGEEYFLLPLYFAPEGTDPSVEKFEVEELDGQWHIIPLRELRKTK
jgi:hypothetical protein